MATLPDYRDNAALEGKTYYEIITAAVADFAEYGYDSEDRLRVWSDRIRDAAKRGMVSEASLTRTLRTALTADYDKLVTKGGIEKRHKGVPRFTVDKLRPQLRAELDRRIMASTSLIKLNRQRAVDHTLQRFGGWATSIPTGGVTAEKRSEVKKSVAKSIKQLPFEERRVIIDQGHKLNAAINNVVATAGGAIAVIWHSHWRELNYDYRVQHKKRDGLIYALKGNWALERGLMNKGSGYYEDMDQVGQEPFCRCWCTYLYNLRDLPPEMLTEKGKTALEEARARIAKL